MKEFCQLENIIKMGSTCRRSWEINPGVIGFNSLLIRNLAESGSGGGTRRRAQGVLSALLGHLGTGMRGYRKFGQGKAVNWKSSFPGAPSRHRPCPQAPSPGVKAE